MREIVLKTARLLWFCALAGVLGIAQANPAGSPGPVLTGFSPAQGAQGSSVNVTFTGNGFVAQALALQFFPQQGLTVGDLHVVSSTQISAQIQIDASAQPGAHQVLLKVAGHLLRPKVPFLVTAALPCGTPGTAPCSAAAKPTATPARETRQPVSMQILRLVPNEVPAGSEGAEVTLEGKNFVPGTLVSFGGFAGGIPDVVVVGVPRYVNSTEMHVTVNVLPLALPGGRDVQLRTPKQETVTGKGMLNVLEPTPEKPAAPSPTPSSK